VEDDRQTVDISVAAQILGVNKRSLYRSVARGDQPFQIVRVGARILIPKAELSRVLAVDVRAAREHLLETLGSPIEISDDDVLDRAAAVVTRTAP
jgi:hypothetical protein